MLFNWSEKYFNGNRNHLTDKLPCWRYSQQKKRTSSFWIVVINIGMYKWKFCNQAKFSMIAKRPIISGIFLFLVKAPWHPRDKFFFFWAQIGHSTHQKFSTWSAHYFETCLKPQQILNQHFLFSSSFLQMQFAKKLFQEWICLFNKEKKNTCTHSIYEGSCCCIV